MTTGVPLEEGLWRDSEGRDGKGLGNKGRGGLDSVVGTPGWSGPGTGHGWPVRVGARPRRPGGTRRGGVGSRRDTVRVLRGAAP